MSYVDYQIGYGFKCHEKDFMNLVGEKLGEDNIKNIKGNPILEIRDISIISHNTNSHLIGMKDNHIRFFGDKSKIKLVVLGLEKSLQIKLREAS